MTTYLKLDYGHYKLIETKSPKGYLINDSLETLSDLERKVVLSRYFEDLTQSETASLLGISQVKVSRIEKKGKAKIKEYIKS